MTLNAQRTHLVAVMRDVSFAAASFCLALHDAASWIHDGPGHTENGDPSVAPRRLVRLPVERQEF